MNRFKARQFDQIPDQSWDAKDTAMWSANAIIHHEQVCSQRWGVLIKLMWWALAGIGTILATSIGNYITHILNLLDKVN